MGVVEIILIALIPVVIAMVIVLLPTSPFQLISNSVIAPYLPYINWLIPVSQIIAILQLWIVAVGVYYLYQLILRWVKAIG